MNQRSIYYCLRLAILCQALLLQQWVHGQAGVCPPNLDFEYGNFSFWECKTGNVVSTGTDNVINWSGFSQTPDQHTIISASDNSLDQYGLFPRSCRNGSGFSVLLGNNQGGAGAEGIFYTFTIPPTAQAFAILYHFAVVLQAPNHQPSEQPRFRARVVDVQTGSEIDCVSFDFTSSPYLPGFIQSSVASDVYYKDWTPISVDLSAYAGKTVRLEFISSDCTFRRHFGYAYVDVNSSCSGVIRGNTLCAGDHSLTVSAPFGFQSYTWYQGPGFNTQISTLQSLFLDPAPPVGTTYPVIVHPYQGFGCDDTLYAVITAAPKPVADAGPDITACSTQFTQIGLNPQPGMMYSWLPSTPFVNAAISSPVVMPGLRDPVDFVLRTTDLGTGCFAEDGMRLTPIVLDTASTVSGRLFYCPDEELNVSFRVTDPANTIQWYRDGAPITGATQQVYIPTSQSQATYWAKIHKTGCDDVTRQIQVTRTPVPEAEFKTEHALNCINTPVLITNKTTIAGNIPVTYEWHFSDGSVETTADVSRTFSQDGDYKVKLIARSVYGCTDSTEQLIHVLSHCTVWLPTAFTPNGDGLNDVLRPTMAGVKVLKRFAVYNRYGNLVFSTTKEGEGWNGTYRGERSASDVYVWMLEYMTLDDKPVLRKGTVTLIR